ncbi:MAG TPA: GDP-mannose 4,6-dehydratase [Patescibacteria group bacterium]|nr:GDP-mannose 4,6-dehydratase [Patescibacteria group bacterium]
MKKVLITGITGFAGQYLAEFLVKRDDTAEIHGTYHSEEGKKRLGELQEKIILHQCDLTQKNDIDAIIQQVQPQEIYHLAAQTSPGESIKDPAMTLTTNTLSELYLLEALKTQELSQTRILVVSTSEIYGAVRPEDLPIDEDTPLRPTTPYAVSKITQDFLALQYFLSHKMQIIRVRPFNHTGPRQQPKFVLPMFAKQIAEIDKGIKEPVMKVGNLKARKDFTDVRDVVRAYFFLMEKGLPGEVYNIGSGKSVEIQEMLDTLLSFTNKKIKIEVDPGLYRPIDTPDVVCDFTKLQNLTSWKPEIPLETTLKDTLEYFKKVV